MPPYAKSQVSDGDVADILAFILALPGRVDAKSIPLLMQQVQ